MNTVLVTFGGGSTAQLAESVSEQIVSLGLTPVMTRGFARSGEATGWEQAGQAQGLLGERAEEREGSRGGR